MKKTTNSPVCDPAQETPTAGNCHEARPENLPTSYTLSRVAAATTSSRSPARTVPPARAGPDLSSRRARPLVRDDRIVAKAAGDPSQAACSGYDLNFFNIAARLLKVIEQGPQEPKALAQAITNACPWVSNGYDDAIPF